LTLILNYTHPITPEQHTQLSSMLSDEIEVRNIAVQIDHAQPMQVQVAALADAAKLTPTEWQSLPLLINPPGYAPAALALIAELHGRIGHFPALVRMRPVAGTTPTRYEVGEIVEFL